MKISDKKLQKDIGWEPFEAQKEIIDSPAREKVVVCGRRFGKTSLAAYQVLKNALVPGKVIWVVAPSYELTKRVIDNVVQWLSEIFPPEDKMFEVKYRPYPTITTAADTKIEGKSTENPVGLLGAEVDLVIMDEAAFVPKNIWETYLLPTTHDRAAETIFISTPWGKNWLYNKWLQAREWGGAFQYPSSSRPSFSDKEWENAKQILPADTFRQQYQAQFVDAAGSVFSESDLRDCVNENAREDVREGEIYTMGVDLAKMKDWTVLTVVKNSTNRVVHIERFQQMSYTYQKKRIKALAERYNNAKIILDSTGLGEPIYDDLFDEGLLVEDYHFSSASKERLVDNLRIFIEQNLLVVPNDKELWDELTAFQKEMLPSGRIRFQAPPGMHDDMVDSLALATWDLEKETYRERSKMQEELKAGFEYRNTFQDTGI